MSGQGEFEKRIDDISEVSMIEDGYLITAEVKLILEEARREFPLINEALVGVQCGEVENRLVCDGEQATQWFLKWFGLGESERTGTE